MHIFLKIKKKFFFFLSFVFLPKDAIKLGDFFKENNITTAKANINDFGGYSLSIDEHEIRNSKEFKKFQHEFEKKHNK